MEKCNDRHKKELLDAIKDSASENCFLYGDIENFSLDSDFMDVWREVEDCKTTAILLRYYRYYVVYTTHSGNYSKLSAIINNDKKCLGISGLENVVNDLSEFITFSNIKNMYLAELNSKTYNPSAQTIIPQKAVKEDIEDLYYFQKGIEEFNVTEESREAFGQEVINGSGRMYYIKEDNKIISTATISAENSLNGMVIGVATAPEHRRKGLAKACVDTLCREMVAEDKSLLLFYDNPNAGRLYKELGFVDINRWTMGIK